jgi:hypothetical protein
VLLVPPAVAFGVEDEADPWDDIVDDVLVLPVPDIDARGGVLNDREPKLDDDDNDDDIPPLVLDDNVEDEVLVLPPMASDAGSPHDSFHSLS